ncbi:hypothetical protein ACFPER_11310 [Agromyces aurantiacus]|uniref:ABC transporter permease n=1 Tax=Agromyces aurantiacus TaxID=165814 RepID=A0ABV9R5H0_9MICO|nr:hypothetical protein [Agromyces aurantiacus]MBM7504066.1 hypothetical protein [Agromyces aurantiacus]
MTAPTPPGPTLTDRYVHAATRTVPEAQRPEFARELRERIGDQIDARLASGAGTTTADAESAVLTELGDPERLAAGYLDRPMQLIGPRYYLPWLRLLKLLLSIVVPISTAAVIFAKLISGGTVGQAMLDGLSTGFSVAVNLAFWVTLVFAIVERAPSRSSSIGEWTLAQLPELPKARQVGLGDLIASIVFLVLFVVALVWQTFTVQFPGGETTPVLNPELWTFWLPYLIGIAALEVVFIALLYRNGTWNWVFAGANVALNAAFAIPVAWLAATGQLLNPGFFELVGWPEGDDPGGVVSTAVIAGVVIIAVWDSVDGILKAWRAQRGGFGQRC